MITLQELGKDYGATTAVQRLDLEIRPDRVTGFLGPNGAGKSTTMRMILGLDRPTRGRALVNGQPYRELDRPLHHVGAHITGTAGHPGQTPRQFLTALARSNRIPRRRVHEVLEEVGLAAVTGKHIRGFSLGMRQRLGIAAALLGEPPVLIFDEPMNGLDVEGIEWIRGLMGRRAAEGATVFVSSHLMSEVQQVADHLVITGQGQLLVEDSTQNLLETFGSTLITVRTTNNPAMEAALTGAGFSCSSTTDGALLVSGAELPRIGALAYQNSIELHELSQTRGSLESVYTQLTQDSVQYTTNNPKAARS